MGVSRNSERIVVIMYNNVDIIIARCYAERGCAAVCRLSVCLSVLLSVRDVQESCSHRLEYFENNFTAK